MVAGLSASLRERKRRKQGLGDWVMGGGWAKESSASLRLTKSAHTKTSQARLPSPQFIAIQVEVTHAAALQCLGPVNRNLATGPGC
jgi:hypothetical protein